MQFNEQYNRSYMEILVIIDEIFIDDDGDMSIGTSMRTNHPAFTASDYTSVGHWKRDHLSLFVFCVSDTETHIDHGIFQEKFLDGVVSDAKKHFPDPSHGYCTLEILFSDHDGEPIGSSTIYDAPYDIDRYLVIAAYHVSQWGQSQNLTPLEFRYDLKVTRQPGPTIPDMWWL